MSVYRKPQVRIECDFADLPQFQDTENIETAAGTWLRCLSYSYAQERQGVLNGRWVARTFAGRLERIEELVRVGLLHQRSDGDYVLSPAGHLGEPVRRSRGSKKAVGS